MLITLLVATFVTGIALIAFKLKEPRTLFFGANFILFGFCLTGLIGYVFLDMGWYVVVGGISFMVIFSLLVAPLALVVVLIYSGINNIKQEGFRWSNTLSLTAGVGLLLYLSVWPMIADLTQQTLLNIVYGYVSLIGIYVVVLLDLYTVTSALNLFHMRKRSLDYLIVLGAGLAGDQVTPLLATRIDKAISIHLNQPRTKLIMSGGQGDDELVAEGIAMANYAHKKGIPPEALIIEDRAVNTEQNIAFSFKLIEDPLARVGVVSNTYHVLRALMLARSQGYACVGYGAHAKLYFSLNAYIREFVAYLYMKRRLHFWWIVVLTIAYLGFQLATIVLLYLTNR